MLQSWTNANKKRYPAQYKNYVNIDQDLEKVRKEVSSESLSCIHGLCFCIKVRNCLQSHVWPHDILVFLALSNETYTKYIKIAWCAIYDFLITKKNADAAKLSESICANLIFYKAWTEKGCLFFTDEEAVQLQNSFHSLKLCPPLIIIMKDYVYGFSEFISSMTRFRQPTTAFKMNLPDYINILNAYIKRWTTEGSLSSIQNNILQYIRNDDKIEWVPGFHQDDFIGHWYWNLVGNNSEKTCFGIIKNLILRYEKVEQIKQEWQAYAFPGRLSQMEENMCSFLDQKTFSIDCSIGLCSNGRIIDYENNNLEEKNCSHGTGASGVSVVIVMDEKAHRVKIAFMGDFSIYIPLCNLIMEGYNGLVIINSIIDKKNPISRHLCRTKTFILCKKDDGLYFPNNIGLVTEHIHNKGTIDVFLEGQSHLKEYLITQLFVIVFILQHEYGVFHNDLNAGNILIVQDPSIRVLKFSVVHNGDTYTFSQECEGGYYIVIIDYAFLFQYPFPFIEDINDLHVVTNRYISKKASTLIPYDGHNENPYYYNDLYTILKQFNEEDNIKIAEILTQVEKKENNIENDHDVEYPYLMSQLSSLKSFSPIILSTLFTKTSDDTNIAM